MGKAELRIEIDEQLLRQAREAEIKLGPTIEKALRAALAPQDNEPMGLIEAAARAKADPAAAEARAKKWAEENAEAIQRHNERIEARGVFGEDLRRW